VHIFSLNKINDTKVIFVFYLTELKDPFWLLQIQFTCSNIQKILINFPFKKEKNKF